MTHDQEDPLRMLDSETLPPPHLKARVMSTLTARGLLRRRSGGRLWIGAIAAAALLFAAGLAVGRRAPVAPQPQGNRFALLLYEDASFDPGASPHARFNEYAAWAAGLRDRGELVSGTALDSASMLLQGANGGVEVTPGGVRSNAGVVGGLFIIKAANNEEALAIARTCPHLRHGGRVVLRPVFPG